MRVRPSVNNCATVCNTLLCNPWCCCMAIFTNMHAWVLQLIWSDLHAHHLFRITINSIRTNTNAETIRPARSAHHFPRMPWSPRSRMHSLVKWQELRHNLGKALPLWCCLSTCLTLLACRPSLYSLNPSQLCNYESPADHLLFKLLTFNLNRWLPIILLDFL